MGYRGGGLRREKPTRKEEVVLLKLSEWSACFADKYNFSNNFRLTQSVYHAFQNEASPSFVPLRPETQNFKLKPENSLF